MPFLGPAVAVWITFSIAVMAYYYLFIARPRPDHPAYEAEVSKVPRFWRFWRSWTSGPVGNHDGVTHRPQVWRVRSPSVVSRGRSCLRTTWTTIRPRVGPLRPELRSRHCQRRYLQRCQRRFLSGRYLVSAAAISVSGGRSSGDARQRFPRPLAGGGLNGTRRSGDPGIPLLPTPPTGFPPWCSGTPC
ncbi:MAG: hypothetical protein QOG44_258 [Acidimicrobiaceae bacterium]|nr:hypothetical protein [Acidimicrobiaceae bacterium]